MDRQTHERAVQYAAWTTRVIKCQDTLKRLKRAEAEQGTMWVAKQKAYHSKRLARMLNAAPAKP